MEFYLNRLRSQYYSRKHLQSLLPSQPLVTFICTDKESWKITFSKNEFSFVRTDLDEYADIKIMTVKNIAVLLISGDMRLSQLKKHNEVVYEGSFRNFLLLESVLWLCRSYDNCVEAVSF